MGLHLIVVWFHWKLNQVSFRAKTWYFHMWKYHRCYGYIINRAFHTKKLLKWNGLIFHWCLYNKKNITWPLGDTKFLFECWKWIFFQHEKRNFVWAIASKKRQQLLSAAPRAALTPLSCSPNFPRAQYFNIRTLTHELIIKHSVVVTFFPYLYSCRNG